MTFCKALVKVETKLTVHSQESMMLSGQCLNVKTHWQFCAMMQTIEKSLNCNNGLYNQLATSTQGD